MNIYNNNIWASKYTRKKEILFTDNQLSLIYTKMNQYKQMYTNKHPWYSMCCHHCTHKTEYMSNIYTVPKNHKIEYT